MAYPKLSRWQQRQQKQAFDPLLITLDEWQAGVGEAWGSPTLRIDWRRGDGSVLELGDRPFQGWKGVTYKGIPLVWDEAAPTRFFWTGNYTTATTTTANAWTYTVTFTNG